MNQYSGSHGAADPDSRSQHPEGGHRFGGGLHGLPETDVADDPLGEPWLTPATALEDSDAVEAQKDRFRAAATDTSVGTESGMNERDSSTGTSPEDDGVENSNLTGSEQSTSAVEPEKKPGDSPNKPR